VAEFRDRRSVSLHKETLMRINDTRACRIIGSVVLLLAAVALTARRAAATDVLFYEVLNPGHEIRNTAVPPLAVSLSSPGASPAGLAVDASGAMYSVDYSSGATGVLKISPDGQTQSLLAEIDNPISVAVTAGGDLYVSSFPNGIERILPDGTAIPFYAGATGPIAVDRQGNVYAMAIGQVLQVTPTGTASTFAEVTLDAGFSLESLAVDPSGNVFLNTEASFGPWGKILKIAPGGSPTLFYEDTESHLFGLAGGNDGDIYTASFGGGLKLDPSGAVTPLPIAAGYSLAVQPVPEPATIALAATGAGAWLIVVASDTRRRLKRFKT
jgi:hypothetical protein